MSSSIAAERWVSGAAGSRSDAGAEAGGGRLPGRADGYPSGPPTDPYVRNSRIRFLKQSFCCPWMQSNGGLVTRLVSAESLSCVCPLHALPDVAFPPVGRLGLTSPRSSVLYDATTALCPSRRLRLSLAFPIPCLLPEFVVSLTGS